MTANGTTQTIELVGTAGRWLEMMKARFETGAVSPVKMLLYGDPGIGKSESAKRLAMHVCHPAEIRHLSAIEVSTDMIRDWIRECAYVRASWTAWIIEEADKLHSHAETLLLQLLDRLGERCLFVATSNENVGDLTERFQSRMQVIHYANPSPKEIETVLTYMYGDNLDEKQREEIAAMCKGDVRCAINDGRTAIDMKRLQNG